MTSIIAVSQVLSLGTTKIVIPKDKAELCLTDPNNVHIILPNDLIIRMAEEIKHQVHQHDAKI